MRGLRAWVCLPGTTPALHTRHRYHAPTLHGVPTSRAGRHYLSGRHRWVSYAGIMTPRSCGTAGPTYWPAGTAPWYHAGPVLHVQVPPAGVWVPLPMGKPGPLWASSAPRLAYCTGKRRRDPARSRQGPSILEAYATCESRPSSSHSSTTARIMSSARSRSKYSRPRTGWMPAAARVASTSRSNARASETSPVNSTS